MTQAIAHKMKMIASHVNDLNSEGVVKAQTANEKGYAKLISINSGCRVWVHHTLDDRLIIDLMITKVAASKYPDGVATAKATFDQFAKDSRHAVSFHEWEHSINKSDTRQQYYFEISSLDGEAVLELVDKVRIAFRDQNHSPD